MKELGRNSRVEVVEKGVVSDCYKGLSLTSPGRIEEDHKK